MIDAIRFGRLVIDVQHLAAPAQAQLARHQMNDDEFVANVERNQRFGPVWPHQINGRNFPVRRKPQHRELAIVRSEEHTSELQSLMRISYAVFCLKKKTNYTQN